MHGFTPFFNFRRRNGNRCQPIAFASRSLNETECRYAQREKEALAITWACERFSEYILGKEIELESDYKPLVPLLGSKHMDSLLPWVLHFTLYLMRFQCNIKHVPVSYTFLILFHKLPLTIQLIPWQSMTWNSTFKQLCKASQRTKID